MLLPNKTFDFASERKHYEIREHLKYKSTFDCSKRSRVTREDGIEFVKYTKCSRQSSTAKNGGQFKLEIAGQLLSPAF